MTDYKNLEQKIIPKEKTKNINQIIDRFAIVDNLRANLPNEDIKLFRKSFALTPDDMEQIFRIKDIALNKKIVLNDTEVIKIAVSLLATLEEHEIYTIAEQIATNINGRPKNT